MKIVVDYAGNRYESTDSSRSLQDELDFIYEALKGSDVLYLGLKEGGTLVLGPDVIKACAFQILE